MKLVKILGLVVGGLIVADRAVAFGCPCAEHRARRVRVIDSRLWLERDDDDL
jgi:hypothetical protein